MLMLARCQCEGSSLGYKGSIMKKDVGGEVGSGEGATPELTHSYVAATASKLVERISSRFGQDHLTDVALQVERVARMSDAKLKKSLRLGRVIRWLTWPWVLAAALGIVAWIRSLHLTIELKDAGDLAQSLDSIFQLLLVLGAGAWFLLSIGSKVQRAALLKALQELNELAQVVDLIQLDKDPDRLHFSKEQRTDKSPTLGKANTAFLLSRYLDYCAELLSILAKVGCLYRDKVSDEVVLSRLGDFDRLTNQLRANISTKMSLISHSAPKGQS
jgi:hypothetical protein